MTHILIDNPHKKDPKELIEIAQCLMRMAGAQMVHAPDPVSLTTAINCDARNIVSEFDSSGARWNPQIHSAQRTKTVDGLWRARRYSSQGVEIEEDNEPVSDFQQFMNYIIKHHDAITPDYLMRILQDFGINGVPDVQGYPEKIPEIMEALKARVGAA